MKILLYGINFAPELTGIGKYTGEMAAWLASAGHEVRVVTAPPYYPYWKVESGYSGSKYGHEIWTGVRVWRAPLWVPKKPSGLKRLLHLASFAISSFPLMLRQVAWRPDVVWVVEPPLFCAPTALLVARLAQTRAWLHIQDFEVDAAFALGLLQGNFARRLVSGLERWLMRRFDRVSTISRKMLNLASEKGVDADRLILFPNWIDLSFIRPMLGPSPYRAELGVPDAAFVALYSGNMGSKQGLEIMGEAARLLANESGIRFIFCGNGAGKEELIQQTIGCPNVQFLDLQPFERLNDLLGMADVHLLPQRADAADLMMPAKLTGMLASGRAIIATTDIDTELGRVLTECGGTVVKTGCAKAFADAINELARNAARRSSSGEAGRKYAETHLDVDTILNRFVLALDGQ